MILNIENFSSPVLKPDELEILSRQRLVINVVKKIFEQTSLKNLVF